MEEAEYCDRIAIIDEGQLVAIDTPNALKAQVGKDRVELRPPTTTPSHPTPRRAIRLEAIDAEGARRVLCRRG